MSDISIVVDNRELKGWNSFTISKSIESLTGEFSIDLIDGVADNTIIDRLAINKNIQIFVEDVQVINGYIYQTQRQRQPDSTRFSISGRDITADLVDCSAVYKTSTWNNIRVDDLVRNLVEPFGIYVDSQIESETLNKFSIQQSESVFDAISRACKQFNIVPITNQFGDLVLRTFEDSDAITAQTDLVDGVNIKSIDETVDFSERYSSYTVKSQYTSPGSLWDDEVISVKATATDPTVTRYRPIVIMNETKANKSQSQKRANWEAQIRAGKSKVYNIEYVGFIQREDVENKSLWLIGDTVNLISDYFGVNEKKIISDVSYTFDDNGKRTNLVLKDPRIYQKNAPSEVGF